MNCYVFIRYVHKVDALWIYHTLLLISFLGIVTCKDSIKSLFLNPPRINKAHLTLIIISLFVFSFLTLMSYDDVNLWLDEYTHAQNSQGNVIVGSARQQQPPGGYILSAFIGNMLGFEKIAIKLTGFIPMLVSLYVFQVLFIGKRNFWLYSLLITTFFIIDFDVRYLSLEGRPVANGVMSLSFCALAIKVFLQEDSKNNLMVFAFCNYLFLTSLGLQPVFLLFSFGVSLLLFYLYKKEMFKNNIRLALAVLIPALLFIPIQLNIIMRALIKQKFNDSFISGVHLWLNEFTLMHLKGYFGNPYMPKYWIISILLLSFLLFIKNFKRHNYIAHVLVFSLLIWLLIFDFSFNVFIQWPLHRYYFSCYYILVNVLLFFVISRHLKSSFLKIFVVLLVLFVSTSMDTRRRYKDAISGRLDWEAVYNRVLLEHRSDRIYVLGNCFPDVDGWCINRMIGLSFYSDNKLIANGYDVGHYDYSLRLQDNGMIYDLKNIFEKKKISILIPNFNFPYENMMAKSKEYGYRVESYQGFLIITTEKRDFLQKSVPIALEWIVTETRKSPERYYPYTLLIGYYYIHKDYERLEYWYNELMSIKNFKNKMNQSSSGQRRLKGIKSLLELAGRRR